MHDSVYNDVCETDYRFLVFDVQEKREVGLTPKMFAEGLSLLCKTGDGLAHAFVRLDATNRYAMHCRWQSVCLSVRQTKLTTRQLLGAR